jgi:hypothetical protein
MTKEAFMTRIEQAMEVARAATERNVRADAKLSAVFGEETTLRSMLDKDRAWERMHVADRHRILVELYLHLTEDTCSHLLRLPLSTILNVLSVEEGRKLVDRVTISF